MQFFPGTLVLAACMALIGALPARAADPAAVQFSFFDVNAPDTDQVKGVRFPTIYGKGNTNLVGWDIPILAWSELDSLQGVHWAPWLISGNHIRGDMKGVTVSAVNWHEGQDTGVNLGLLNLTNNVAGVNWSFVNYAKGHSAVDVGFVNVSDKSNFQLSWVNVTQKLDGLQLGLINCAKNGFLPCFVLFNFGTE
jgi:hypothetical protein